MTTVDALSDVEQRAILAECFASVAHDVRNRLASTRQALYFLKTRFEQAPSYKDDPRVDRFFGLADGELEAASEQLAGKDVIARFGAEAAAPFDVREAVRIAIAGVDGRVTVDAQDEVKLVGELRSVAYALRCLVRNAVEAGPPGAGARVKVTSDGRTCVVRIEDDGPGLDAAGLRKIVTRFYTTKPGRLGLGASIARRVAQELRGKLVAGTAERGGAVELQVPLEEAT